jgi:type IV pilus assembly protein PilE
MNARTCRRNRLNGARGFTLMELIITMVIIGILAVVAIPQYSEYINRSRRAEAQAFLLEVAARQQHFLVDRRQYNAFKSGELNNVEELPAAGGLGMRRPANMATYYDVTSTVDNTTNPPTFTIAAAPKGSQSGERCGTMTVDQAGERRTSTNATGCWSRTGT